MCRTSRTTLWYELVRIGNTGKAVVKLLKRVPEFTKLGIGRSGHLIHSDEWTNSLFVTLEIELRSGVIQCVSSPTARTPGTH